jgi:hypothetical protein
MALLVIPPLHVNHSIKGADCLRCQLSLTQASKRSQRIEPCWNLFDASSVNSRCSPSVTGEKGLQQIG